MGLEYVSITAQLSFAFLALAVMTKQ
jgi:hypothetical protein